MDSVERFYQFVFDATSQGAYQFAPQGRLLRANASMAAMCGYGSPGEMAKSVKNPGRQLFADAEEYKKFKKALDKNGTVRGFEIQIARRDGKTFRASINADAARGEDGKTLFYSVLVEDISFRDQGHKARNGETRYQTLMEQAPVAVYIDSAKNNIETSIYISPQIETITGYTPAEWNSPGFWHEIVHPDDRENFRTENERTDQTGESFDMEYRVTHKRGHVIWLRDIATLAHAPDGKPLYWNGTLIDVTEQKNLKETIRQSDDRFRKAFLSSPIATCITTLEGGVFLDANEAYLRLSGFQRDQIVGRSAIELGLFDEQTRAKWIEEFLDAGQSLRRQNSPFVTVDKSKLETLAFYEGIEIGGTKAILSMFYDITSQRRAEQALQHSEERYRALVEHIPAIVYLDDAEGEQNTIYISPQVETITGFTPEEWRSDPIFWEQHIHPDDHERVIKKDSQTNQSGESFSEEYRFQTRDGRWIWIQEESHLIRDTQGNPLFWQGFLLDVTGKREAQEALGEVARAYRGLFDSVSDAIYIQDQTGRFLDVNLGAEKL